MTRFAAALRDAAAPVIAEVKPHSPKDGALLGGRSVADLALGYARAGVPCLSVTTGKWHGGTPDMIRILAATGLPVLRKDFIATRGHLEQSHQLGASAVLLTCTLLRPRDVWRLASEALAMGLTPFVEAASDAELLGLDLPKGAILAINNRNIRERETDDGGIERSLRLYDQARRLDPALLVSASAISCPKDIRLLRRCGFDAVLVGTALMAGRDTETGTRRFLDAARIGLAPASGRPWRDSDAEFGTCQPSTRRL